jgi:hypothetical protein
LRGNPFVLKLPQLLAHYLYQNKSLALPGIGTFSLDPTVTIPSDEEREKHPEVQGISFTQNQVIKADPQFIEYIHFYTGKMIPLAESDLDSFLRLGIQMLHIGKPFVLEGIGSITKHKNEKFEFTPGIYSEVNLTLPHEEKGETGEKRKKTIDEDQNALVPQSRRTRGLLIALGIVVGLLVIAWAGFNLYKKKTFPTANGSDNGALLRTDTESTLKSDTSTYNSLKVAPADTAKAKMPEVVLKPSATSTGDSLVYKFVILETNNKFRALRRLNQLLSYQLNVKMDTKDSSFFKVYFPIRTSPKDTLQIKDSLSDYYATKTLIEQ